VRPHSSNSTKEAAPQLPLASIQARYQQRQQHIVDVFAAKE
jgi:hypothetical protein